MTSHSSMPLPLRRLTALTLMSILGLLATRANASPETDFWKWFQANQNELFNFERDQEHTFDRLAAEMQKVDPRLTFEFGPKKNGQREFVISADGIREAFPKVESLYATAPKLAQWKFVKFRPRRDPSDVAYSGITVKAKTVSVLLRPDGDRVAITMLLPGYKTELHNAYLGVTYLMLDQALGEYDVETRVGEIAIQAPNASTKESITLQELPHAFDAFFMRH